MHATVTPLPRLVAPSRLRPLPRAPSLLRASFSVLSHVTPALVLDRLHAAYFTPRRYRASVDERAVLAMAVRFEAGRVVRYEWTQSDLPWENPPGRTAVLFHGWSGSAAQMTPFVGPLLAAGFRVVAYDFAAHGAAGGTRTTLVEVAETIREACTPGSSVVAHSLGASAVLVALQQGLAAERLALISTGTELDLYPLRFAEAVGATKEVAQAFRTRLLGEFGEAVLRPAEHTALRFTQTPTLLVHDLDDSEATYAGAQQLAQTLPAARLVTTAGLGHRRLLKDKPVIDEVVRFFSE